MEAFSLIKNFSKNLRKISVISYMKEVKIMDHLHIQKMKGFHLDVARYTFNYLFDLGEQSIVVRCNQKEAKELKAIFNANDLLLSNKAEYFISITLKFDNFVFLEVDSQKAISYEELKSALYRSASKEDSEISLMTQKRLFKQSLDYGFRNLRLE